MRVLLLMMVMPVFVFADSGNGITRFGDTGVFQPLERGAVAVSPDGHVYVANFADAVINHYGPNGEKLAVIGSKGKGPGEYTYIINLFFRNGKLYVDDLLDAQMSELDASGTFLKRFKEPERGLDMVRTPKGWIYGSWSSWSAESQKGKLLISGPYFENTRVLMELKDKTIGKGAMVSERNGKTQAIYNPITTHPKLAASRDGNTVFISDPWLFKIYVFDPDGNMQTIKRAAKRIPFDLDWGKERLKATNERRKGRNYTSDFPEYFPVIRDMVVDPKGNLVVDRWRGRPDDKNHPITIDMQGNESEQEFDWELLSRLVGVVGDHVYVTIFDTENEEAGIARVPISMANDFARENPIEFDGRGGYSVSISY